MRVRERERERERERDKKKEIKSEQFSYKSVPPLNGNPIYLKMIFT